MTIVGYFLGIFMGMVLGLLGGGGSILTVPIVTYLFLIPASSATSYSLFIVGVSAIFGMANYQKRKLIDYRVAIFFATSAFISIYLVRQILLPSIPSTINFFEAFELKKDSLVMLVFSTVMLAASFSMLRGQKKTFSKDQDPLSEEKKKILAVSFFQKSDLLLILQGLFVGALTGFVGAGGGFLIIPGLVFLAKLPMKRAVGTSLLIVSINSLIGFTGDLLNGFQVDWSFLLSFTGLGVLGVFIGAYFSGKMDSQKLKPLFGYFVLIAGTFIIIKEVWL